jgi:predicted transcriptional regulator
LTLDEYVEQISANLRMSKREAIAAITRLVEMGLIIEDTTESDEKGQSVDSE